MGSGSSTESERLNSCAISFEDSVEDGVGGNSPVNRSLFARSAYERLRILETYRRIAMVGLSSNPFRPSHFAAVYLISEGYDVIPVNPRESQVLGRPSYRSLLEIPGPVEVVDIFREPSAAPELVEEAIAIGAKVIWMQLGVVHEEAASRARSAGLEVVMDRCMKIEHARFFGGLNTIGMNTGLITSQRRGRRYPAAR
jgi:predicted CoA-binding protein